MASRMASTCDHYAAGCTKTEPEILQVKRGQKQRNAPGKARKRRNWVRFGCWRGWERLWAGANGWKSLAIGQKDLVSAAAAVGSRQSATGARSPLGTRFWSGCGRAHQGAGKGRCHPVPAASPRKAGAGLVLRALFGEGLCIDYHFFLRKKSTSARRMAKLTRITAG